MAVIVLTRTKIRDLSVFGSMGCVSGVALHAAAGTRFEIHILLQFAICKCEKVAPGQES